MRARTAPESYPFVLSELATDTDPLRSIYRNSLMMLLVWTICSLSLILVYELQMLPPGAARGLAFLAAACLVGWWRTRLKLSQGYLRSLIITAVATLPVFVSLGLSLALKTSLPALAAVWFFGLMALTSVVGYEINYRRSYAQLLKGELERAYHFASRALVWWPDGAPAHALLASLDNHAQRFSQAQARAERALAFAERDVGGYYQLAEALEGLGHRAFAWEVFREGMKNARNPDVLSLGLGWSQWRAGRYSEAEESFEKLDQLKLSVRYGHLVFLLARAECAEKRGDRDAAAEARSGMAAYADEMPVYQRFMDALPQSRLSERYLREFRTIQRQLRIS